MTPIGRRFEEIGLGWLFQIRGIEPAPEQVTVISVDKASARHLQQPAKLRDWDRSLHAKLVRKLRQSGASLIAFDVFFDREKDGLGDGELAQAISEAKNVILFQQTIRDGQVDRLVNPVEKFAEVARALAPFSLPKIPERVSFYWPFHQIVQNTNQTLLCHAALVPGAKQPMDNSSESRVVEVVDAPSLPVVLYFLHAIGSTNKATETNQSIRAGEFCKLLDQLRIQAKSKNDSLLSKIAELTNPNNTIFLNTLQQIIGETGPVYINYYGPPKSINTIRYAELFDQQGQPIAETFAKFSDKIVLIGGADVSAIDQMDGFPTVFTEEGLDINGVEIAATALANLLQNRALVQPSAHERFFLVLLFGLVLGFLAMRLSGVKAGLIVVVIGAIYFFLATKMFTNPSIWLPVFTPLAIQIPLLLVISQTWKYLWAKRQSEHYRASIRYYIPEKAAQQFDTHESPEKESELVYGVCLASDVESYTTLSESISPTVLADLKNEYFETLTSCVNSYNGEVLHVEGDSLTAIWIGQATNSACRSNACLGALEIIKQVREFNQGHALTPLNTRIGLLAGEVAIGNIGGSGRFTYSLTGDTINTASRIENLNKYLGTRLLAGAATVDGLDDV
ncbi:MAG: adenylate/guanylate cyclase domain-containing protein, partial [Gammaproteobacteria bacterium]|nr:adenylate/guanylate cyclase domain-containing protein [Gammaproteobacteria bacterium]